MHRKRPRGVEGNGCSVGQLEVSTIPVEKHIFVALVVFFL